MGVPSNWKTWAGIPALIIPIGKGIFWFIDLIGRWQVANSITEYISGVSVVNAAKEFLNWVPGWGGALLAIIGLGFLFWERAIGNKFGYVLLNKALIDAYSQLRSVDSIAASMSDTTGGTDNDSILNSLALTLISPASDRYLPFQGKAGPSTSWEDIPKETAMNGRFSMGGKIFLKKDVRWSELRVKKSAWRNRVKWWRDGIKSDATVDEIFGDDSDANNP